MTSALKSSMTLTEYLSYDDGSETRYEFVDGELIEISPESDQNTRAALRILEVLLKLVSVEQIRHKDTDIVTTGRRVRFPDLIVLSEELSAAMIGQRRSTILPEMPAPLLVVEVVSPGKSNRDRDYRYKRAEYAARGIPEYWIIDPPEGCITVLSLVDGLYEEVIFRGSERILSSTFLALELTVEQVLQPNARSTDKPL